MLFANNQKARVNCLAFKLAPALAQDCMTLGHFELSQVLLMNDAHYPWLILVPKVTDISEIFELSEAQQQLLMQESNFVLETLCKTFKADKMNQAALGNMVSQLHIHHVVRFKDDIAWPGPVWGKVPSQPYDESELEVMVTKLVKMLSGHPTFTPN